MVGAGTFLNPLLKVVSTVAILAAIYFFMVRPILDTTEDVAGGFNENISQATKLARQAEKRAQQQGDQSFNIQASGLSLKQAERIQQCVQNAGQDVDALQACGELATRLSNK